MTDSKKKCPTGHVDQIACLYSFNGVFDGSIIKFFKGNQKSEKFTEWYALPDPIMDKLNAIDKLIIEINDYIDEHKD